MIGGFTIMRFIDRAGPIVVLALPIIGGRSRSSWACITPRNRCCSSPSRAPAFAYRACITPCTVLPCASTGEHPRPRYLERDRVGRAGGIVAPYLAVFLSAHMPLQQLMIIAALPCIPTRSSSLDSASLLSHSRKRRSCNESGLGAPASVITRFNNAMSSSGAVTCGLWVAPIS